MLKSLENRSIVGQLVESKTAHARLAWVVTLSAALFFFYAFFQLNLFNAIDVDLMKDFGLNAVQLGQFASMYFYANLLFLFPAGILLDRYSTKKLLLMAVAVSTLGTFLFAMAHTYFVAALGRFLVGAGAAFCFLSCIRIASRWFPPSRMAFATGIVVVMAMLGGLVAQTPFALLTQYVGDWRTAALYDACLGLIIFAAIAYIVQDRPPGDQESAKSDQHHLANLGLWRCIKLAALNPQNWLGGIYTSLMNLPVFLLGALWGIHYLVEVHHLPLVQASYATTFLFLGLTCGSPAFGWLSDKIGRRVVPMLFGAITSIIAILMLMYIPNLSLTPIIILFFAIGFFSSSQVLSYPTIAELNPIFLTSTAVSIDSMCVMASGFIFQPFFGWILEKSGNHEIVNGVITYTATNFNYAMWIIPISFALSFVVALLIRETYCKSQA